MKLKDGCGGKCLESGFMSRAHLRIGVDIVSFGTVVFSTGGITNMMLAGSLSLLLERAIGVQPCNQWFQLSLTDDSLSLQRKAARCVLESIYMLVSSSWNCFSCG